MNDLRGRRVLLTADGTTVISPDSLLTALVDEGLDVVGASPPGPFGGQLRSRGIPWVALRRSGSEVSTSATVRSAVELFRLFRRRSPDIVHVHGPGTGVAACAAARLARVPGVVRTLSTSGPGTIVPSRSSLWSWARTDQSVEPGPGVDLDRFRPRRSFDEVAAARTALGLPPFAVVVATVGPVDPAGMRTLREVAKQVSAQRPDVVFVVTDPEADLKPGGSTPGVVNIVPAGQPYDMADLYAAFHLVLVMTTGTEVPSSVLEAVAAGLPVVAVDGPVGRRVVDDGVNGILAADGDTGALAGAIALMADDPARRGTMGVRSQVKAASEFDEQSTVRATLDAYRRLAPVR